MTHDKSIMARIGRVATCTTTNKRKKHLAMTEDTRKPRQISQTKVDAIEAFDAYKDQDPEDRSLRKIEAALREKGKIVSYQTISRWAKKHNWPERVKPHDAARRRENIKQELKETVVSEGTVEASEWARVLREVMAHCTASMQGIIISTPSDLKTMVEVGEAMQGLIADLRGDVTIPQSAHEASPDLGHFGSNARRGNGHLKPVQ